MADLFVMPSTGEGFSVAFLETMASATPALDLAVAEAREVLVDDESGATVSEGELPATIARLLNESKPDSAALSAATRVRFGRERFANSALGAMNRLIGAA